MSVAEILEQIRAMSHEEREALLAKIQAMQVEQDSAKPEEHWGQNLLRLLDELPPVELAHPEIEDPVEWVETMRREARQRRMDIWNESYSWDRNTG